MLKINCRHNFNNLDEDPKYLSFGLHDFRIEEEFFKF